MILDDVLFVYALTNTKIAGIHFLKTKFFSNWVIMAILSAKSNVKGFYARC